MQFLITATFAVISLVGVASSCPSVCNCTDTSYGVKVNCSNRNLDRIPTNLPINTDELYLQNNEITNIYPTDFQNMPVLNEIDLSFNQITAIKSDTFKGLPKLNWLHLESNKISVIEDNAFNSSSLGHIDLESNQIRSIKSDTFKDMPLLYDIRLRSNKISVIEENAFNNLARLRYLYLYHNKITSIRSGIFKNLPGLISIYLSNNRISEIEDNVFNNDNLPALWLLNMKNNKISFVNDKAFVNLPHLESLRFDMQCGCNSNIPFWQWLKVNQKFLSSIDCYDYNGLYLENLQPNNFYKCPAINGNWGVWEAWGTCSRTCGGGYSTRYRSCDSPPPANGGSACTGVSQEAMQCSTTPCPAINGNWGVWKAWGTCSRTCGGGYSTRYRSCDSPPPANGGSACTGVSQEAMQCSTTPCPVHGNWGEWGAWSSCSTTCGDGILTRYRSCDNPTPAYGGSYCQGNNNQTTSCITIPCPEASEEDSSSAAIAIGATIGSTAVVVGLLIVFIYPLKRYRLRKRAESVIYETTGDTGSSNSDLYIYDGLQQNTESPTHRQNDIIYVNMNI